MGTHPIFESDFDCLTEKKMADNVEEDDPIKMPTPGSNKLDAIVTSENRDARELFGLNSDRMLRKFEWNFQNDPLNYKTSERCMAHKDGKRDVWLNIEVLSKIVSITIEYDPNGTKIKSASDLRTKFIRGQFDSSQINNY